MLGVLAGVGLGVIGANVGAVYGLGLGVAVYKAEYVPTHIGIGCLGSGGDIWAMDESDFPLPCERIEAWPPSG